MFVVMLLLSEYLRIHSIFDYTTLIRALIKNAIKSANEVVRN